MKKILVRSGMSPTDNFNAKKIIERNSIGNNNGNLIYAYSIYRNLTDANTKLYSDYYKKDLDDAEFINENYDAYILPLANGIRKSFIPSLNKYTSLIKKLNIPVYVIGFGAQFPYEPEIGMKRSFDDDVRKFVKAVLEKSAILGLRGQITSDYLSHLGFKEGRDHEVIGCPSMYTFGNNINIKELKLNSKSLISVNMTPSADYNILNFLNDIPLQYENINYIPQDIDELMLTYSGYPLLGRTINKKLKNYPNDLNNYYYKNGKVKYFLNVPTWIDFMKSNNLSIGTRLHGNIISILAGTPSVTIPIDSRMRELVEYHKLPSVDPSEINNETTLEELLDKVDLNAVENNHEKNFKNFLNFLSKNNIAHIYDQHEKSSKNLLDIELESIKLNAPVNPIVSSEYKEIIDRLENGYSIALTKTENSIKGYQRKLKNSNKKISNLKRENTKLKSKLNEFEMSPFKKVKRIFKK